MRGEACSLGSEGVFRYLRQYLLALGKEFRNVFFKARGILLAFYSA